MLVCTRITLTLATDDALGYRLGMSERTDQARPNAAQTWVTVAEAAQLLGLSVEAVRSRLQRGTLQGTKEGGTVYVLLDTDQTRPNTDESAAQTSAQTRLDGDQTAFIASLEEQIEWLRREVERKDTLLMSLMQRIPELEAPTEPPDARQTPGEGPEGVIRPGPSCRRPTAAPVVVAQAVRQVEFSNPQANP
jgi:hypothetical protein